MNKLDYWKISIHMRLNDLAFYRRRKLKKWEDAGRPVPPPHTVKKMTIDKYAEQSNYKVFVETGTYWGAMIWYQRNHFKRLFSIELDEDLWRTAVKRFRGQKHVKILKGDSGKVLPEIVKELNEPAIFWLDGHYSGGVTAKGDKECPIYEEIDAVFRRRDLRHILLIDDARDFVGRNDYPTIEALTTYIKKAAPGYTVKVENDIIQSYPQ